MPSHATTVSVHESRRFVQIPAQFYDRKSPDFLPPAPREVLACLLSHASKSPVVWPSQERLAEMMCCSVDTIQRSLSVLIERDLISIEQIRAERGRWKPNRYDLLPVLQMLGRFMDHRTATVRHGQGKRKAQRVVQQWPQSWLPPAYGDGWRAVNFEEGPVRDEIDWTKVLAVVPGPRLDASFWLDASSTVPHGSGMNENHESFVEEQQQQTQAPAPSSESVVEAQASVVVASHIEDQTVPAQAKPNPQTSTRRENAQKRHSSPQSAPPCKRDNGPGERTSGRIEESEGVKALVGEGMDFKAAARLVALYGDEKVLRQVRVIERRSYDNKMKVLIASISYKGGEGYSLPDESPMEKTNRAARQQAEEWQTRRKEFERQNNLPSQAELERQFSLLDEGIQRQYKSRARREGIGALTLYQRDVQRANDTARAEADAIRKARLALQGRT